jgi:hypothetical protein
MHGQYPSLWLVLEFLYGLDLGNLNSKEEVVFVLSAGSYLLSPSS